jgi:hypothetical protein
VNLPPREVATTSLTSKLEAALGCAGLLAAALLALLVLYRRRELILLREQIAAAMALESRQRPLLATAMGAHAVVPPGEPAPGSGALAPTIYRARRTWRRGALAVAAGVPIVAILAFVAVHFVGNESPSPTQPGVSGASVPVAVFNASTTAGEAHRIADELKAARVDLGQVGNIKTNLGTGVYVLYPSGARTEARRVARRLASLSPTVEPIRPAIEGAVGKHDEIVVILG